MFKWQGTLDYSPPLQMQQSDANALKLTKLGIIRWTSDLISETILDSVMNFDFW